jgi:hypothetical protein
VLFMIFYDNHTLTYTQDHDPSEVIRLVLAFLATFSILSVCSIIHIEYELFYVNIIKLHNINR